MNSSYTQVVELEWEAERQAMLRVARRREEEVRAARHIERARAKLQAISYSFYGQVPRARRRRRPRRRSLMIQ